MALTEKEELELLGMLPNSLLKLFIIGIVANCTIL